MTVFISYANVDGELIQNFMHYLRQMRYSVDATPRQGDQCGADWMERINGSVLFVAVMSPAAVEQEICQVERAYAQQQALPMVVVLLKAVPQMPAELAEAAVVDARGKKGSQAARLLELEMKARGVW
ncbi:MAG: TIR domain-containing protein [Anaerolineae bacterium]|nr:TIR domain-containing protein [Anaerolineae bacterium]